MKIANFPEFIQASDYDCGAMAMQAVLAYYGFDVGERKILKIVGTTRRHGTHVKGIERAAKKFGLKFRSRKMTVDQIKKYIDRKIPVIALLQAWTRRKGIKWEKDWRDGHYVVVIGYNTKKFYFEDPATILRTYLTFSEFEKRWHDVDTDGKKYVHHGIAIYGKKPQYDLRKSIHMD
jgi:ABC-type bacteriocin/lantibiotic exporter with double-glycine peptidase domain